MFEQGELSNKEEMNGYFLQQILPQNVNWLLSYYRKTPFRRGLILKPEEKI